MAAPIVQGLVRNVLLNTSIAASDLFIASDADDAIISYFFEDYQTSPTSGYFTFNGAIMPQGVRFEVLANDLSKLRYVAGSRITFERARIYARDISGNLSDVRNAATIYSVRANITSPWARAISFKLVANESIVGSEIVWGFDPDGYAIESFNVRDRNVDQGHFELRGVSQQQGIFFTVSTAELKNLRYVTSGPTSFELFDVVAFDGVHNSFNSVGRADTFINANRPTVRYSRANVLGTDLLPLGPHLNISDADGNTIKKYRFLNNNSNPTSGELLVNGVAQRRQIWFEVDAADLDKVVFKGSNQNLTQNIRVMAFDGLRWSVDNVLAITGTFVQPPPPIVKPVYQPNRLVEVQEQLRSPLVAPLFSKLDTGKAYTTYEIFDPDIDPARGYFAKDLIPLAGGQIRQFTAAEFENQITFYTGAFLDRSIDTVYVRANNGNLWGDWEKIDIRTEPEIEDVLVSGSDWNNLLPRNVLGQMLISFSFMQQFPSYGGATLGTAANNEHFKIFNNTQRANARNVFRNLETIINVQFLEVADTSINSLGGDGGIIRMGEMGDADGPFSAFAYYPSNNPLGGDMWFNRLGIGGPNSLNFIPGTFGHKVFQHELGHAMGLKHPHEDIPRLPPSTDFNDFTVMSYQQAQNGEPTTYQIYDIATLQAIYGANTTYNSDDTTYSIAKTWAGSQQFVETIWDSGGTDTLSAFGSVGAAIVDLRSGQRSTIGTFSGNVKIAFGAVIENGIGSENDDQLFGNAVDNYLEGRDGNDYLFGSGGNDFLTGGAGDDEYEFGVADGQDTFDERLGGGIDKLKITPFAGLDSLEQDFRFRLNGNDLLVDLRLNDGDSQGLVRIKDQTNSLSRIETLDFNGVMIDLQNLTSQATDVDTRFRVTTTVGTNGLLVTPV